MKDTAAPGALGRFASVLILHPLDTLKTRAQAVSTASRRTAETAIYRSPGAFGGVAPAITGQVVNAMLTCVGYEVWKRVLTDKAPDLDARSRTIVSAVMGDVTGHLLLAPAEVMKAQLQLRLHPDLRSAASCVLSKGPTSWFRGYGSMLMRDVPYRALQIVVFDEIARAYMAHKKAPHLTLPEMLATGAAAGCTAAAITTPFDLVRSRMILQQGGGGSNALSNLASALSNEGAGRVLLGSAFPRLLSVGASTALFFAVYEAATHNIFQTRTRTNTHGV